MNRFVCSLLLLLGTATATSAAITEVAGQRAVRTFTTAVGSGTQAFTSNVASGNLIVVTGFTGGAGSTVAVTDSRATPYTVKNAVITGGFQIFIAWGITPTAGPCTVTVDPSGATGRLTFTIDEFTGQHPTPLDVDGGTATGTDASPTQTITPTWTGDLLVGVMSQPSATTITLTPGSGYTQIGEVEDSASLTLNAEFQVTALTTAQVVNWTMGASATWYTYAVALKAADGVPVGGGGAQIMRKRIFVGQ